MAAEQQNFSGDAVQATITSNINNTTTSVPVSSTAGFPPSGLPFTLTIDQGDPDLQETVFVRSYSGLTLTLDSAKGRGYDSTTAQSHSSGAIVVHTPDAMWYADMSARAFAVSALGDIPVVVNPSGVQMGRIIAGSHYQGLAMGGAGLPVWSATPQSTMVATGDILYASAPNTIARLGIGASGTTLLSNGTTPSWGHDPNIAAETTRAEAAEASITSSVTAETTRAEAAEATITAGLPSSLMTTEGDLIYENATPAPARLPIGAARRELRSTGVLPAWDYGYLLEPVGKSGAYNAVHGDYVEATGAITITLPAPTTANQVIGVTSLNGSGASPCTVATASGGFAGPGISGLPSSILLGAPGAFVICVADGTNWIIAAGQQDSGWLTTSVVTYRLQGNVVRFGLTGSQASGGTYGTLPAGYRPNVAQQYPAVFGTGTAGFLQVTTGGAVQPSFTGGGTPGLQVTNYSFTVD